MFFLYYYSVQYTPSDYFIAFVLLGGIGFILLSLFIHWFISTAVRNGILKAHDIIHLADSSNNDKVDKAAVNVECVNDFVENKDIDK